jgi:hypothetical protein
MRDNVEAEGPEDYFRKSITVPFCLCKHYYTMYFYTGADPETLLTGRVRGGGSFMEQYF